MRMGFATTPEDVLGFWFDPATKPKWFNGGAAFDDEVRSDDAVFERDGVKLVVDEMSLELLAGSEVDYVEELIGASFQVKNPNAASSCGCGTSFAI